MSVELADVGWPDESVTHDEFSGGLQADFPDRRGARGVRACLAPGSYVESQALPDALLEADSLGVVYPSVRRSGGT